MALDSRDKRAGAMGDMLTPMMPQADGEVLSAGDRQMAVGVYPGVQISSEVTGFYRFWLHHHHHHNGVHRS